MKLTVFEPHLHAAGVRMCLDAIWKNTTQTLSCAGYNHSWVKVYPYADSAAPLLPKGTILRVTGYFDTTRANKNLVDPRNWTGMGNRSIDNMMVNISMGIVLSDEEVRAGDGRAAGAPSGETGRIRPGLPVCVATSRRRTRRRSDSEQVAPPPRRGMWRVGDGCAPDGDGPGSPRRFP